MIKDNVNHNFINNNINININHNYTPTSSQEGARPKTDISSSSHPKEIIINTGTKGELKINTEQVLKPDTFQSYNDHLVNPIKKPSSKEITNNQSN